MSNSNVYIKSGIWRKTTTPVKGELNLDAIIAAVSPPSAPSIMIAGPGTCSTMRDGNFNSASGLYSTVGGGYGNTASNPVCSSVGSTVSGGINNTAYNSYSTISGGIGNVACGNRATVGGGYINTASGNYSTVSGGYINIASGYISTVSGGRNNTASGTNSGILGGQNNTTAGFADSFIVGSNLTAGAACTTYVNALSKTSGTFRINHPNPAKTNTHYLQHSFVESPTAGDNIYRHIVRTCNCSGIIELPDYHKYLNENDQVFISATCHLGYGFGVVNKEQTCVTVTTNSDGEYNVLLIGTRKDVNAVTAWDGIEILK